MWQIFKLPAQIIVVKATVNILYEKVSDVLTTLVGNRINEIFIRKSDIFQCYYFRKKFICIVSVQLFNMLI